MSTGLRHCLTCADEALVGIVLEVDGHDAIVEVEGRRERVAIELVGEVAPGDRLLCHAGVAIGQTPSQVTL